MKTKQLDTPKDARRLLTILAEAGGAVPTRDEEFSTIRFEVLKVGQYYDWRYGNFEVTEGLMERLKANFENNVLEVDVALDINHDPTCGAFAWVNTLEVENGVLLATFKDFTKECLEMLKEKKYRYFSVEFAPFVKIVNGEEVTHTDVLRGIALTNRPVIKGMKPTFMSEDISQTINQHDMNAIMKLAEHLSAKEIVSKDEKALLRGMFDEVPAEEQTDELKEKVDEVEAKPEEAPSAEGEAEAEEETDPADAPAEDADAPAEGEPEELSAADVNKKLAETQKQLDTLLAEKRERTITDRTNSLVLSESSGDQAVGFAKTHEKVLSAFIGTLSDAQYEKFSELVKNVTVAKLGEIGHGEPKKAEDEASKAARVAELAEQYQKDGMKPHHAVAKAQKEVYNS